MERSLRSVFTKSGVGPAHPPLAPTLLHRARGERHRRSCKPFRPVAGGGPLVPLGGLGAVHMAELALRPATCASLSNAGRKASVLDLQTRCAGQRAQRVGAHEQSKEKGSDPLFPFPTPFSRADWPTRYSPGAIHLTRTVPTTPSGRSATVRPSAASRPTGPVCTTWSATCSSGRAVGTRPIRTGRTMVARRWGQESMNGWSCAAVRGSALEASRAVPGAAGVSPAIGLASWVFVSCCVLPLFLQRCPLFTLSSDTLNLRTLEGVRGSLPRRE